MTTSQGFPRCDSTKASVETAFFCQRQCRKTKASPHLQAPWPGRGSRSMTPRVALSGKNFAGAGNRQGPLGVDPVRRVGCPPSPFPPHPSGKRQEELWPRGPAHHRAALLWRGQSASRAAPGGHRFSVVHNRQDFLQT